jgi:penicillin amidase
MRGKSFLKNVFIILVFIILGLALAIWLAFRFSLPGKKARQELKGLQNQVTVTWDKWGVPHLKAEKEEDLFFATGYVQARERLWQMELFRRLAQGRLAEVLGRQALDTDLRVINLGFREAIQKDYERLDQRMKQLLQAYANGVNAYLDRLKWNWPPEFLVLRYRPEPWKIEDTLSLKYLLALGLSADFESEIIRGELVSRLGARALDIMEPELNFLPEPEARVEILQLSFERPEIMAGSNNWVISGKWTASGRPILANDPHLAITVPPIWLEMGLECPEFKAAGMTLPGVPLVVIGHNEKIAWGVTNSYADVQDLFLEKLDQSGNLYLRGGEWKPLAVRKYDLKIRGEKQPFAYQVRWTEEGPVLGEKILKSPQVISLRWSIYEGDDTVAALYQINRAGNWEEFCRGASLFACPSQNFVYADVAGNIGYYLTGKIPRRKKEIGPYPYPGWKDEARWEGYLTEEEKPNQFNPEKGYLITANNNILPPGFNQYLSYDWLASYRKDRIEELLLSGSAFTVEKMIAVQNDVFSKRAERVRKILAGLKFENPQAEEFRKILGQWSGEIKEGLAPAVYEVFMKKLEELTLKDDLGPLYERAASYFRGKYAGLDRLLDQPESDWFDLKNTPEKENRDSLMEKALLAAVAELQKEFGPDRQKWDWARMHELKYQHLLGQKWFLSFFNCGTYPMIGDSSTVRASFGNGGWRTTGGPSCRLLLDLQDLEASLSVLTSGQSGHFLSRHYRDQIPLYLNNLYHPLSFSEMAVEKVREKTEKFLPARQ